MSSENTPPSPPPATGSRKPANSRTPPPEQPPLKCPRCDSANTKFCYYNNYSLSQPRHFCKTCRRYWTKGGALRNVPIGGACRRTKKVKPPNAVVSEFGPGFKFLSPATTAAANTAAANTAAVDFQLGGLSLPRLHPATAGVYTQFVAGGPAGVFGLDLSGLNYPNSSGSSNQEGQNNISISSIESLSSINQEMHWKLQQQRLALIYGNPTDGVHHHHNQKQTENSPMIAMNLFQNNNNNNYGSTNEIENGGVNLNWGNLQQEFNGLQ